MPGLIEVVYCPNPLLMVSRREIRRVYVSGSDTVDSVIKRLGLSATPLEVTLNSVPVRRRRARKRVHAGDVLELMQRARDPGTATLSAKIIMDFAWYEIAAQAALMALAYIGPALALSFLSNVFSRKPSSPGSEDSSPSAYSISGGSNTSRQYAPLLVTLGEHRLYPDYGSAYFSEFVLDPVPAREVTNNGWFLARVEAPGWSGGFQEYPAGDWTPYAGSASYPQLRVQSVTYMQHDSRGVATGEATESIVYNASVGSSGYGDYARLTEVQSARGTGRDVPWRPWNADPQVVPSTWQAFASCVRTYADLFGEYGWPIELPLKLLVTQCYLLTGGLVGVLSKFMQELASQLRYEVPRPLTMEDCRLAAGAIQAAGHPDFPAFVRSEVSPIELTTAHAYVLETNGMTFNHVVTASGDIR